MNRKQLILSAVLFAACAAFSTAQISSTTANIAKGLDAFTVALTESAPNTVSHQNMWADAYIGQLIGIPPHFGGGISAGAAQLDFTGLQDALNVINPGLGSNLPNTLFLPTLTADVRLGGFLIPFDIGLHGMIIPGDISFSDFDINFGTFGADIRFPLIKQNLVLPNLSLGAGFAYSTGNIAVTQKNDAVTADLEAGYEACIVQASLQLSKEILFITPFIGMKGTVTGSKRNYNAAYNFTNPLLSSYSSQTSHKDPDWIWDSYTAQIYGGIGIDILFITQLTVNGSYDLINGIWAAGASFRVKL